jgi:hypothetical protein
MEDARMVGRRNMALLEEGMLRDIEILTRMLLTQLRSLKHIMALAKASIMATMALFMSPTVVTAPKQHKMNLFVPLERSGSTRLRTCRTWTATMALRDGNATSRPKADDRTQLTHTSIPNLRMASTQI